MGDASPPPWPLGGGALAGWDCGLLLVSTGTAACDVVVAGIA